MRTRRTACGPRARSAGSSRPIVPGNNTDVAYSFFTNNNPGGPYQKILIDNNDFLVFNTLSASAVPVDHGGELPFMGILILNQFNTAK